MASCTQITRSKSGYSTLYMKTRVNRCIVVSIRQYICTNGWKLNHNRENKNGKEIK